VPPPPVAARGGGGDRHQVRPSAPDGVAVGVVVWNLSVLLVFRVAFAFEPNLSPAVTAASSPAVTVRDCGDVAGGSLLWRNLKTGGQYQIVNTVWLYCRVHNIYKNSINYTYTLQ
jgi:hypothetical protein